MIIKTMEQLGKCIDGKVELELRMAADEWAPLCADNPMDDVTEWIEEGRIRTKPKEPRTVDVVLYWDNWTGGKPVGDPCNIKLLKDAKGMTSLCVRKYTIPLDGE